MIRFLSTCRLYLFLLISCCLLLQSCAPAGKPKSEKKIGMHIDAVLEFVVEYPLSWGKDRRISYGSKEGEIRWKHPDHPDTLLTIRSSLQKQQAPGRELQIDQELQKYVGLEISLEEKVTLPAGEAWHVIGHTEHVEINSYLFSRTDRSYLIILTASPDRSDSYKDVMDRVTHSFQFLP